MAEVKKLNVDDTLMATLLVVAWLHSKAQQHRELWEMVGDKAKEWIKGDRSLVDMEAVIEKVLKILG